MIIAGQLLLTDDAAKSLPQMTGRAMLRRGWLRVDRGMIAKLAIGDCPHTVDLGGDDCLISPGLIDTHLHLPQFDCMGRDGLALLDWLDQVIFPVEARWADAGIAADMTQRAVQQLFAHGTTSFCAYATVHHEATRAACEVIDSYGVRAAVGQVLMDRDAPAELCRPAAQLIDEAIMLVARYPRIVRSDDGVSSYNSRLEFAITPRFAISCSEELLSAAGKLAQSTAAMVQTHLSENKDECEVVRQRFGCDYTSVYHRAGLLGPRTILGHGIYLNESERRTLASTQSIVAHCPTANLFLQSGVMPRGRWLTEGVRISLGSDIGAGTERSMVRVARAMIDAAKTLAMTDKAPGGEPQHRRKLPTAEEAWYQITAGNADALGYSDVGRLRAGNAADLLIIRPDVCWLDTPTPLATLLYAWDDRWLQRTLVAGREVYNNSTRRV